MKKKLLILLAFVAFSVNAQTTYNLDWHTNFLSPATDLTIIQGDTVIWTWTDALPHTVQNNTGSVETFGSATLTGIGQTFMHTFTVVGTNPYFCGIHGANSMSGVITVDPNLGLEELSKLPSKFSIYPNPSVSTLNIDVPNLINDGFKLEVFDVLGKKIHLQNLNALTSVIDITKWNSGLYLVRITSKDNSIAFTKRFVKL